MNRIYYIFPVAAGILFGSAGSFVRPMASYGFNAVTIVAQRSAFAVILLAVVLLLYDRTLLRVKVRDLWVFALAGIFGVTIMNVCYNVAMRETTLALAAVLLSIFPIFVFLFARIFFGEKITKRKVLCSFLAILGCYMVSDLPGIAGGVPMTKMGIIMGALTPLFYSMYTIGSRFAVDRGYRSLTITFYSTVFMVIVLTPFADWGMVLEYGAAAPLAHWSLMIGHAICVLVLPYMLFTTGIQHIDAGKASILSSCEPASAMVFGAVLFGEIPAVVSVAGLILVAVAISVISMPEKRDRETSAVSSGD